MEVMWKPYIRLGLYDCLYSLLSTPAKPARSVRGWSDGSPIHDSDDGQATAYVSPITSWRPVVVAAIVGICVKCFCMLLVVIESRITTLVAIFNYIGIKSQTSLRIVVAPLHSPSSTSQSP